MSIHLHHGDALDWLPTLPAGSIDALITDPPYSSGGLTAGERKAAPGSKYGKSGGSKWTNFAGDARDQRAQLQWMRLWLAECERLQGFPDNYTRIPYRGKPAEHCPDDPRYKAIGNAWPVPVIHWLGQRLAHTMRGT